MTLNRNTAAPALDTVRTGPKSSSPAPRPGRPHQGTEKERNLLSIPAIRWFLTSKLYPAVFSWPTIGVFALIVYSTLWGPPQASANAGSALTWVLWWPAIPILFFLLGRFWCAICPFATLNDLVQRFFGLNYPVPKFLKKYGIWIIDAAFILITWADHIWGIVESPRGTGYLLTLLVTGVVLTAVFFPRRTWCRYLCFLGGLSGNYSRSGILELRATPEICKTCAKAFCYKGNGQTAGCPVFEFPKTMDTNAECNLCANCLKTCPNESIRLSPRPATSELWFIRKPKFEEAFLAIVIVGIVLVQNATMLSPWKTLLQTLETGFGVTKDWAFTGAFLAAMALPFAIMWIAGLFSAKGSDDRLVENFTRFGYAVIPLDLAGHVAHNLYHLLAEGLSVVYTTAAVFGVQISGSNALLGDGAIKVMQFALITLGTLGSIYTVYKIASRNESNPGRVRSRMIPYAIALALFGILNIWLFTLPMAHRV